MSKLSLGAYGSGGHIASALRYIGGRVVLLADTALDLAPLFPDKVVVGRVSVQHEAKDVDERFRKFATQPLGNTVEEAYALGTEFAALCILYYPQINVWTGYCEGVATGDIEGYQKYAAFELAFTRECHRQKRKSCVLNLGVGVAQPHEYPQYFADLLAEADYVGFHAYGSPESQLMQAPEAIWYALRYRLVQQEMAKARKRMPPVILTECTTYLPWRGEFDASVIASDLTWLASEIFQDSYVLGGCGFQIGSPGDQWAGFDLLDSHILDTMALANLRYPNSEVADAVIIPETELQPTQPETEVIPELKTTTIGNGYTVYDLRGMLPKIAAYPRRDLSVVRFLVMHHVAADIRPKTNLAAMSAEEVIRRIATYHTETLKWPAIGYGFFISLEGYAFQLHDLDIASYQVASRNHETLGICMEGDWSTQLPPDVMLDAARRLNAELQYTFGWFVPVVGHTDIAVPGYATACPGVMWPQWRDRVTVTKPVPAPTYQFVLGFKDLADKIGSTIVGKPLENERPAQVQHTDKGVMVWTPEFSTEWYAQTVH